MNIQWRSDISSTCNEMAMTMMHDIAGKPFLYIANKEAGLKIYDISIQSSPALVATVPIALLGQLHVMNLTQSGNYLYLALGNTFTNPQKAGMAIVDISSPTSPSVMGIYVLNSSSTGAGIVKVEGNYAYLGAMQSGLIVLDISNKSSIQQVSQFIPGINFPPVLNPNPQLYNARGMEVQNIIVYLCYDAGGVRIINCNNKMAPKETGRWCNPVMFTPLNRPKAYNNIIVDGSLAYVAVDYCGMELLNISDTAAISMNGWWNPYNCPNNNWFTSPVHSNEISYNKTCKKIFLSTGKSDMMVVDVTNPAAPDSCNFYGGSANNLGTWGLGLFQDQIYLSYICAAIPFTSNWTGVKILNYSPCAGTEIPEEVPEKTCQVYLKPTRNLLHITLKQSATINETFILRDLLGNLILKTELYSKQTDLEISLSPGLYFYQLGNETQEILSGKILVQ
ncbi:MAG: T9SS type A sorting domain-containing protein [bacterium]|nr:T9SS type A sorting domain-containing protein [bacterium]